MSEKLLPCPFCGGEPSVQPAGKVRRYAIYCAGEECFGPATTAGTEIDATVQWNTRSGVAPQVPDGWILVPRELTAENGAKAALIGEFSEDITVLDEHGEEQDASVPVSWDTIKSIHRVMVRLFDTQRALSKDVAPPAQSAAIAAEPVADIIERCAQVAVAMTQKWGDPDGNNYQQGAQDQGIRIIHQIRALKDAAPTTSPEPNCSKSSNGSPEPDAVRPEILRIIREAARKFHVFADEPDFRERDKLRSKTTDEAADAILAALSRPAHGGWEDIIERCAKIAEDYEGLGMETSQYEQGGSANIARNDIAKAIRALAHTRNDRGSPAT